MVATSEELQRLSDTVWDRTWRRLDGLTDDEYLWEPAPGMLVDTSTARWHALR